MCDDFFTASLGRKTMTVKDFEFLHPSGPHISHRLKDAELISVLPEVEASKVDMRNGWVWYRLPQFMDGEVVVGISLGFNSGVLQFVRLADANAKYGAGWSEWSEEKERLRAASIGSWLVSKGYPVGTYSWGAVWAGYDAKGNSGSASVQYAVQHVG
jgi:hypothetical protein